MARSLLGSWLRMIDISVMGTSPTCFGFSVACALIPTVSTSSPVLPICGDTSPPPFDDEHDAFAVAIEAATAAAAASELIGVVVVVVVVDVDVVADDSVDDDVVVDNDDDEDDDNEVSGVDFIGVVGNGDCGVPTGVDVVPSLGGSSCSC